MNNMNAETLEQMDAKYFDEHPDVWCYLREPLSGEMDCAAKDGLHIAMVVLTSKGGLKKCVHLSFEGGIDATLLYKLMPIAVQSWTEEESEELLAYFQKGCTDFA